MRRFVLLGAVVALTAGCFCPPAARAVVRVESTSTSTNAVVPGKELAHAVSEITGVAISPLLGASAIGAWQYYRATPQQRDRLPWFAQPWFWIPAFVLVAACFLKDTLGLTAPRFLKKPLDVADTMAHKVSGLIATGAFVPLVMSIFPPQSQDPQASLSGAHGFLAVMNLSWLGNGLLIPLGMLAFFMVFLASNAINILILLSPFAIVDAALKSFRLLILSTVALTAFVNPWLGAVWALMIIAIAYFIAGWSFRLSHLGVVFLWDFLTLRRTRFVPAESGNRMFLAAKANDVPARSYGKLLRAESGALVLSYRPWLVLPERTLLLPEGPYAVGKGLFYSQLMRVKADGMAPAMLLPPRYRGHEEKLVGIYGLVGVRDAGLRAAFRWFKGLLGFRLQPA